MKSDKTDVLTIPPALEKEIRAAAADAHRPANEIVQEALEGYLAEWHVNARPAPDAKARAAAGVRMRERRKGRFLPEGMTIKDMIADGRA